MSYNRISYLDRTNSLKKLHKKLEDKKIKIETLDWKKQYRAQSFPKIRFTDDSDNERPSYNFHWIDVQTLASALSVPPRVHRNEPKEKVNPSVNWLEEGF